MSVFFPIPRIAPKAPIRRRILLSLSRVSSTASSDYTTSFEATSRVAFGVFPTQKESDDSSQGAGAKQVAAFVRAARHATYRSYALATTTTKGKYNRWTATATTFQKQLSRLILVRLRTGTIRRFLCVSDIALDKMRLQSQQKVKDGSITSDRRQNQRPQSERDSILIPHQQLGKVLVSQGNEIKKAERTRGNITGPQEPTPPLQSQSDVHQIPILSDAFQELGHCGAADSDVTFYGPMEFS